MNQISSLNNVQFKGISLRSVSTRRRLCQLDTAEMLAQNPKDIIQSYADTKGFQCNDCHSHVTIRLGKNWNLYLTCNGDKTHNVGYTINDIIEKDPPSKQQMPKAVAIKKRK